jgi:lambda family phage portal protein
MSSPKSRPKVKLNALDRAIGVFSPQRAAKRLRARAFLALASGYYGGQVNRTAGGRLGTLGNWTTRLLGRWEEESQHTTIANRARDLVANDPHAASGIKSLVLNAVGRGLTPLAQPKAQLLGISDDQAQAIADQQEWNWMLWEERADASGKLPFGDVQWVALYSMLVTGDFVALPLMLDDPGRPLSLALQILDPLRLATPNDKTGDERVRQGIELDAAGAPVRYWIANPAKRGLVAGLSSTEFLSYPAWIGHRPGVLHGFRQDEPEQVRGVSVLAPAMKAFRDFGDYMEYELVGAMMAAAFALFITTDTDDPQSYAENLPGYVASGDSDKFNITELEPGMVAYLRRGQKVQTAEPKRPSQSFDPFVKAMTGVLAASMGIPNLVMSKDFGDVNYSSARAALLEAWRTYEAWRGLLVSRLCRPTWRMVQEEAWLRGRIRLPKSAPDFYDGYWAYLNCGWLSPPRGNIDPVKEMEAYALALANHIMTRAEVAAEMGGDWADLAIQAAREQQFYADHGLSTAVTTRKEARVADKDDENAKKRDE